MLILMSIIMARRNIGEKNNKRINKEVIGIKKIKKGSTYM